MIKVFEAIYNGETVLVEGKPVNVPILGEGLGSSSGYLVISEGEAVYLPKTTPDVKEFIEIVSASLSIIQAGIFNSNLGGDIKQPTFDNDIISQKQKLEDLKGRLK